MRPLIDGLRSAAIEEESLGRGPGACSPHRLEVSSAT